MSRWHSRWLVAFAINRVVRLRSGHETTSGWANPAVALTVSAMLIAAGCAKIPAGHETDRDAEARAVAFLAREAPAWSRDNGCFSCHNNGDAARALFTARRKGYQIADRVLADTTAWVSAPEKWNENKGEPGFSDQRLADVQFAASLVTAVENGYVRDHEALLAGARRVIAGQAANGSWPVDAGNVVGSPATYGTTLATVMAWRTLRIVETDEARAARARADRWLETVPIRNTTAAAALLLWSPVPGNATVLNRHDAGLKWLRVSQTADGGWGPYAAMPPEVFDTALALLALSEHDARAGVGEMISRGRAYVIAQQLQDGSWPATTRPSGGVSYAQQMSTTGWATLALLATRPSR